ncbi:uncharacterized protein LOC129310763 [Prosopis cineraria]|uniref:uncharacterized protein LOC129310763 n=1 Tax=Prosopis cineraria TaxID=364024 RepID=UPI00240FA3C4|nr:uncharacterized protein LOC129310763 [Prosopis cineraria]
MTENEKKTLCRLAMTFFISKDVLYKRGYDGILLHCVSSEEAKKIMVEVHEGICGVTPYSLVYGMETVTPIEMEIPSLRVLTEADLEENEWVKTQFEKLNTIEEKRLTAIYLRQLYQKRMARAFDKKLYPWEFSAGDLVLKKIFLNQEDNRGK